MTFAPFCPNSTKSHNKSNNKVKKSKCSHRPSQLINSVSYSEVVNTINRNSEDLSLGVNNMSEIGEFIG